MATSATTLLFSDIEGSTERWERNPDGMQDLLALHDETTRSTIRRHDGQLIKLTGDGALATFDDAVGAVRVAIDIQREIATHHPEEPLRLRMGIHHGTVENRDGDVFGLPVNRAARIMGCAHGGQIVAANEVVDIIGARLSEDIETIDLGAHRLKGLRQAERIVQLCAPGLPHEFPPLRSMNASTGWLPSINQTMVNRAVELTEIPTLLGPGTLVTLLGPGGVGKTKLALHIAHDLRSKFTDGVWFVDLAEVSEPDQVAAAMAGAIGLDRDSSISLLEALRHRCTEQSMLLLIDNCEHVISSVTDTIRHVHGDASHSALLCTSQRRLGLDHEHSMVIDPLTVDEDGESAIPASVQLFVDRAREVQPGFELSDEHDPAVRRICRELDGLPLAIELAASRVRQLAPAEIASRLDQRFALLRSRDNLDRHRTLANAIGWSFDLLDDADRHVLMAIAVFQGGFDWRGAAAVSGLDEFDTIDSLDELTERSLVMKTGDRVRLLDSVRTFALERLPAPLGDGALRAAHADWMEASLPVSIDGHDAVEVSRRLDAIVADMPDLRAAFTTLLTRDPGRAAAFTLSLVDVWTTRTEDDEGLNWIERCLETDVSGPARSELLGWASGFSWRIGDNERSERWASEAMELAERDGLPFPTFAAARLAIRLGFVGDTAEALALAERAEHHLDDDETTARLAGVLATVFALADQTPRAIALADRGVEVARRIGVIRTLTAVSNRMIVGQGGRQAPEMAREVIAISKAVGRASGVGHARLALALSANRKGDLDEALIQFMRSCDVLAGTNQRSALANMFEFIPRAVMHVSARHAAVLFGALDRIEHDVDQMGTGITQQARTAIADDLRSSLDDPTLRQALDEGARLSVHEALDYLHWVVADHLGERAVEFEDSDNVAL